MNDHLYLIKYRKAGSKEEFKILVKAESTMSAWISFKNSIEGLAELVGIQECSLTELVVVINNLINKLKESETI